MQLGHGIMSGASSLAHTDLPFLPLPRPPLARGEKMGGM